MEKGFPCIKYNISETGQHGTKVTVEDQ